MARHWRCKKAMSGRASGVRRRPRFTFWLTFISKFYVTFILQRIAFIFGKDGEEDQKVRDNTLFLMYLFTDVRGLPFG